VIPSAAVKKALPESYWVLMIHTKWFGLNTVLQLLPD
jgi:hypothetical protein